MGLRGLGVSGRLEDLEDMDNFILRGVEWYKNFYERYPLLKWITPKQKQKNRPKASQLVVNF